MIIVSTISPAEAAAAHELLKQLPAQYGYQVCCLGHLVSERDPVPSPGPVLIAPVHRRMRELLIGRGTEGWKTGLLWDQLLSEGLNVSRETVHCWLAEDERAGYVFRTGKPRNRWIWKLPEGAEDQPAEGDGSG